MTETEQIRPLELLHQWAAQHGYAVCLVASCDRRVCGKRTAATRDTGAELDLLAVVKPAMRYGGVVASGPSRWQQLARGTTHASVAINGNSDLDQAALKLLRLLVPSSKARGL